MSEDDHRPVTIHWLNTRLIAIVIAVTFAGSMIVSAATVAVVSHGTNEGFRTASVNGCDGSNLLRGVALLALPGEDSSLRGLLHVRDCGATYDSGRVVNVDAGQEDRFLTELAANHRVAVRGKRLVRIP